MAVVRKYASGGTTPTNEYAGLQDFFLNKLSGQKFTKKGELEARALAKDWISLADSGTLKDAYSFDPVTKQYTIKSEALPENLRELDWSGNPEGVKPNIFGQISTGGHSRNKLNSLFAGWVNEYSDSLNKPKGTEVSAPTEEFKIKNIKDYVKDQYFGSNEDYLNMWERRKAGVLKGDESLIKQDMMNMAKNALFTYNEKMKNPEQGYSYSAIPNYDSIMAAINKGDYNTFVSEANKLGWDPEELVSTSQIKENTEQKDLEAKIADLRTKGFSDDFINDFIGNKYDFINDDNIGGVNVPGLQDYLKQNNLVVVKGPTGNPMIVNKSGQAVNRAISDLSSPLYGTYWGNNENGEFSVFTPGSKGWSKEYFADPLQGKAGGIELTGSSTQYPGWSMTGYSPLNKEVNRAGNPDYTKRIVLSKDGQEKEVVFKDGKYLDLEGNPVDLTITGYGSKTSPMASSIFSGDKESTSAFGNLPPVKVYNTIDETIKEFKSLGPIDSENAYKYKNVLRDLLYKIKNSASITEQNKAFQLYSEMLPQLESLDEDSKNAILNAEDKSGSVLKNLGILKKGGVIKGANGMTVEEYVNRYTKAKDNSISKDNKIKSNIGTLKDMNAYDVASLAGSVASIFPGLGAIGGAVTTVSDIGKDIAKDGFQASDIVNWNTAANLGITALGLIGLGGAGSAAKAAAKTSKAALPFIKTEEVVASKVLKSALEKLAKPGAARVFKDAGITADELKALKEAGVIKKGVSLPSMLSKGIGAKAGKSLTDMAPQALKTVAPEVAKKSWLAQEFSGTIKAANKVKDLTNLSTVGKAAGVGLLGTTALSGIGSGMSAWEDAQEGGFRNIQTRDLKNLLFLTSGIRGGLKTRQLSKNASALKTAPKESSQILQLGDKELKLNSKIELPKFKSTPKFGKEKIEAVKKKNEEIANKFKEQLKGATTDQVPENILELMKKKMKIVEPKKTAVLPFEESGMAREDYNRAIRFLENRIGYWNPTWLKYRKEGGVLKAQSGTKMQPVIPPNIEEVNVFGKNLLNLNRPPVVDTKKLAAMTPKTISQKGLDFANNSLRNDVYSQWKGKAGMLDRKFNLPSLKGVDLTKPEFLNALSYASTLWSNADIARSQKKAALAGIVNLQSPSKEYVRTPSLVSPLYQMQIPKVLGAANRLGSSVSDIDKRAGIMLAAQKQGNELFEKGQQADQQIIQGAADKRSAINAQWNAATTEMANRNKLGVAEAQKSINLIDANKRLANDAAFKNMLLTMNQNKKVAEQEQKYKNYYDLISGPESKQIQTDMSTFSERAKAAKENWEKVKPSIKSADRASTWEESAQAKALELEKKALEQRIKDYREKVFGANQLLQMPIFAKGGSMSEKKELIRYRTQITRQQKEEEQLFKDILKNNELMLKSLIRVFK